MWNPFKTVTTSNTGLTSDEFVAGGTTTANLRNAIHLSNNNTSHFNGYMDTMDMRQDSMGRYKHIFDQIGLEYDAPTDSYRIKIDMQAMITKNELHGGPSKCLDKIKDAFIAKINEVMDHQRMMARLSEDKMPPQESSSFIGGMTGQAVSMNIKSTI